VPAAVRSAHRRPFTYRSAARVRAHDGGAIAGARRS
jgi:hypothetical protein